MQSPSIPSSTVVNIPDRRFMRALWDGGAFQLKYYEKKVLFSVDDTQASDGVSYLSAECSFYCI